MTIRERIEAALKAHGPMDSRTMRKRGLKHDALAQTLWDLVERKVLVRLGGGPRSSIYGLPGQKLGEAAPPPSSEERALRAPKAPKKKKAKAVKKARVVRMNGRSHTPTPGFAPAIKTLQDERSELLAKVEKVDRAIEAIQALA